VRTRVGYAGGTGKNPTYYSLGGHSETLQLDFDPGRITYDKLLEIFWHSHDPAVRPWSRQYASIIFYHNQEQKRLAEEVKFHQEEMERKSKIYTDIVPYSAFYLAEDYHQKYWLQAAHDLMDEFRKIYPNFKQFIDSTAAARINGVVGGYGTFDGAVEELGSYGLSPAGNQVLMTYARHLERRGLRAVAGL
jgi:peptide-methionine (S)-S-oxide reductase